MDMRLLGCALIAAITVIIPLGMLIATHRKGIRKTFNKLGMIWVISILALYSQQFIF